MKDKEPKLTDRQWIAKMKRAGFSLYKTAPTQKKLRLLYKIQKMTAVSKIG